MARRQTSVILIDWRGAPSSGGAGNSSRKRWRGFPGIPQAGRHSRSSALGLDGRGRYGRRHTASTGNSKAKLLTRATCMSGPASAPALRLPLQLRLLPDGGMVRQASDGLPGKSGKVNESGGRFTWAGSGARLQGIVPANIETTPRGRQRPKNWRRRAGAASRGALPAVQTLVNGAFGERVVGMDYSPKGVW